MVLVGFKCDPVFRAQMTAAAGREGLSQFIRDALIEKLRRDGFEVPDSLAEAAPRTGKGGPKKGKKRVKKNSMAPRPK